MDSLQNQKKPLTLKPGLVNLPGATPASTALVVELLRKDVADHHCYFNDDHFHNHLSHQILSLHDLGASAECVQAMYDKEAAIQRPLHPNGTPAESNRITEQNWTSHMGEENAHMYPDYVTFFTPEIAKHGVPSVLERYLFSPEAVSVRVVLDALKQPLHKAQLLQAYAHSAAMFVFLRGRPCIDPALVMSYTACPAPPKTASASGLGG
ncbi:hypothetical protein C8J57DRAFT_1566777 [Mycena rebaudengoi]|nr:hypothetical protein C8J57DRAFT_1566777 [Mycena rebaudengoi]